MLALCLMGCAARETAVRPMSLHKVILYQNGIGYFERTGHVTGQSMALPLARGELDDVLKTLTVIDRLGAGVATVDVPKEGKGATMELGVRLAAGRVHDVTVSYAVPTPTWKAAYRVVLGESPKDPALLQAWAMVNNTSQEDWNGVQLTLATGAPMSFALDLHTPQFVARPDATGHMVQPTVTGVITSETAASGDNDRDGILDVDDKCPDEPGNAADGCPAMPHAVRLTQTSLQILQKLMFARGDDRLAPTGRPLLDAIGDVLEANPDIRRIEVQGHASSDEADAWGLAMRRAEAVRAELLARGIEARRVTAATYGSTQALGGAIDADRRVEFVVLERDRGDEVRVTPAAVQASARAATKPAEVAGAVRYVLTDPVTIKKGASSMVSIVNKPVDASDVYLWRPDAAAAGSDKHPYRAVKLENTSGYTLEPGPVAIFSRGTFVGDAILGRLGVGELAWVPYALDGSTTVSVDAANGEKPVRVVSVKKGVLTVESSAVRTTAYKVAAGREPADVLWVRHAKAAGFTPVSLPARAIDQGDAWLIPVALAAGKVTTVTIEERSPRTKTIELMDGRATELGAYLEGPLPAATAEALKAAVALRGELARLEEVEGAMRERMGDLSARTTEIRQSLRALDRVANADDLRKKLVASLAAATVDIDGMAKKLAETGEAIATTRAKLQDAVRDLEM